MASTKHLRGRARRHDVVAPSPRILPSSGRAHQQFVQPIRPLLHVSAQPARGPLGLDRLRANDDLDRTDLRRDDDVDLTRRDLVDDDGYEQRVSTRPAKTSAAAVFALVFGLSSLLSVLTVVLSPLALVLGIIGIILGVVGLKMARRPGVTGKGTAVGGLVLAIIGTLLAIAVGVGVTTFLNNQSAVDRLQHQVDRMRDSLPSQVDVPGGSTGS